MNKFLCWLMGHDWVLIMRPRKAFYVCGRCRTREYV